jgi:hypothetical protein
VISDVVESQVKVGRVRPAGILDQIQSGYGPDPVQFHAVSGGDSPVSAPKSLLNLLRASGGEPAARVAVRETAKAIIRTEQANDVRSVLHRLRDVDPKSLGIMLRSIPGMDVNKTTLLGGLMQIAHDSSDPDVRKMALDQYTKVVEAEAKNTEAKAKADEAKERRTEESKRENVAEHRRMLEAYMKAESGDAPATQEAISDLLGQTFGERARPKAASLAPGGKKAASATTEDEE